MIQEAESGDQGVERRGKGGEKEARERPESQGSRIYFTLAKSILSIFSISKLELQH